MTGLADQLRPASPAVGQQPAALNQVRHTAWQRVAADGLPAERDENWKYSRLGPLQEAEFDFDPPLAEIDQDRIEQVLVGIPHACRWVFVDGCLRPELSGQATALVGIEAGALVDHPAPDTLLERLAPLDGGRDAGFANLANAGFADGLYLNVNPGYRSQDPLAVVHINSAGSGAHWRGLVQLAEGVQLEIVEVLVNEGDAHSFTNHLLDISCGPGSQLSWTRVQQYNDRGRMISRTEVRQQKNSRFDYLGMDLGGRWVRHDVNVALAEPGAGVSVNGVFLLEGKRHVDNHSRIDHMAPDCSSQERFKGIAGDAGRGIFNGKLVVHPGADGTDAAQTSANILLSDSAEIDTKPELEIYADEVVASHGATVGQLDEQALFYLRSRGIGEADARHILIQAFCQEVVDGIANPVLRKALTERLGDALPGQE